MKLLYPLLLIPVSSWSLEPMDKYYANDLLDAVDQAKVSAHHYDYSNHYRYKRTTAQSINLNRLNHNELDETILKTTTQSKIISMDIELTENKNKIPLIEVKGDLSKDENLVNILPNLSLSSSYLSSYGELNSSGIQSSSKVISTPRP